VDPRFLALFNSFCLTPPTPAVLAKIYGSIITKYMDSRFAPAVSADAGKITGAMLAVARVAGETAPLLLTTFLAQDINLNAFNGSQTSLPTFIWDQISRGTTASVNRAWGAALALILFVLIIYAVARILAARFAPKSR
jgi:phosphate transport system permease protein